MFSFSIFFLFGIIFLHFFFCYLVKNSVIWVGFETKAENKNKKNHFCFWMIGDQWVQFCRLWSSSSSSSLSVLYHLLVSIHTYSSSLFSFLLELWIDFWNYFPKTKFNWKYFELFYGICRWVWSIGSSCQHNNQMGSHAIQFWYKSRCNFLSLSFSFFFFQFIIFIFLFISEILW